MGGDTYTGTVRTPLVPTLRSGWSYSPGIPSVGRSHLKYLWSMKVERDGGKMSVILDSGSDELNSRYYLSENLAICSSRREFRRPTIAKGARTWLLFSPIMGLQLRTPQRIPAIQLVVRSERYACEMGD